MSISVRCSCGTRLQVRDDLVGKRIKCPKCGQVLQTPPAEPPEEITTLEEFVEDSEGSPSSRTEDLPELMPHTGPAGPRAEGSLTKPASAFVTWRYYLVVH